MELRNCVGSGILAADVAVDERERGAAGGEELPELEIGG